MSLDTVAVCISIGSFIISLFALRNAARKGYSDNINACNIRYCDIIEKIEYAKKTKSRDDFETYIIKLTDLFCHQFMLWREDLIPNTIFLSWSKYNHEQ